MKKLLLSITLLTLAGQATAEPAPQNNWYLLAGASYTFADGYEPETLGARGGEFGFGWTLGSGWVVNDRLNFEIAVTSKHLSADGSTDVDQYGFDASGLYFLNRNSRMAPYLVMALGGVDNNEAQNQGFELYAAIGAGLSSRLGDSAGAATIRLDARFVEELGNRSLNDAVINLALQIPVGSP